MDIDTAPSSSSPTTGTNATIAITTTRSIKIHPLAIIGISDHHTRVVTGGSALPPSAPVVGLLFGYYTSDNKNNERDVSIVDAEEMEYPKIMASGSNEGGDGNGNQSTHRAAIRLKIELHQKVFPQHKVVGWYRVQKKEQCDYENSMNVEEQQGGIMPSEEDLRMSQTEMARYCCSGSGEDGEDDGEMSNSPLFVLMNAALTEGGGDNNKKPPSSLGNNNASEEMECDEELPLTVYETLSTSETSGGGSAVFVNADFELETYEPERIAVEKVFKTQPSKSAMAIGGKEEGGEGSSGDNRKTGKKSKKDGEKKKQQQSSFTRGPTELDSHVDSLQSSIRAMNVRMNVLLEFLQSVERGEIQQPDDALLRSVDGLVRQLPLILAALEEGSSSSAGGRKPLRELENEYSNTMLLTYLAAVAKTAKSVHVYSKKFRNACESGKSDPRRPLY